MTRYARYIAYLYTPQWAAKRAERAEIDGHRCVFCHSTEQLTTHHATYARLFDEPMSDLVTLCWPCHSGLHEVLKGTDRFVGIVNDKEQRRLDADNRVRTAVLL